MKKYTNEDIRLAAYYIWEQIGKPWGKEDECWHMALEQLMIYDTPSCSKKTKCATKKSATSTTKCSTTKCATKSAKVVTPKAKTSLKATSSSRSTSKVTASNTTDFSHFRSNASSLKSKVSLNTNRNIDSNYNLKIAKKSLI